MSWRPLARAALVLGVVVLGATPQGSPRPRAEGEPRRAESRGYVGSSRCGTCHQREHQTWHRTYHRTMTRTPDEVFAARTDVPELPVLLEGGGFRFQLSQDRAGRIWAQGPDLHRAGPKLRMLERALAAEGLAADPSGQSDAQRAAVSARDTWLKRVLEQTPERRSELVLVTGSHHYLAFWLSGGDHRELRQLPFVYLLGPGQWAPREEVFLQPPEALPQLARWNANCIQCHTVAGEPRERDVVDVVSGDVQAHYETRVAELGIACEACHGPGEAHAAYYQNPARRYIARAQGVAAYQIASPPRLEPSRASALCGQCHAYFVPTDPESWWETGFVGAFLPGDELVASRQVLLPNPEQLRASGVARGVESFFWGDGSIRVGGREYNGLLASPCYEHGTGEARMSCGSCHSLHAGTRDDQLTPELAQDVDAACKRCHASSIEHSGHLPASVGASCVNCHMPRTTYALLKAIRSHRVTSPSLALTDPPSACVLCHVDRTRDWVERALRARPGVIEAASRPVQGKIPNPGTPHAKAPGSDPAGLPFAIERALTGNAAERAIFAANLASSETQASAGAGWSFLALRQLTRDPYHAVRRIAARSLAELPSTAREQAQQVSQDYGLSHAALESLLAEIHAHRDDSPIVISE